VELERHIYRTLAQDQAAAEDLAPRPRQHPEGGGPVAEQMGREGDRLPVERARAGERPQSRLRDDELALLVAPQLGAGLRARRGSGPHAWLPAASAWPGAWPGDSRRRARVGELNPYLGGSQPLRPGLRSLAGGVPWLVYR
jgi:hypothetical protein